jgi:hypothetical protein
LSEEAEEIRMRRQKMSECAGRRGQSEETEEV